MEWANLSGTLITFTLGKERGSIEVIRHRGKDGVIVLWGVKRVEVRVRVTCILFSTKASWRPRWLDRLDRMDYEGLAWIVGCGKRKEGNQGKGTTTCA